MPYQITPELIRKFKDLAREEKRGIIDRKAKTILGASIMRVFKKDTKPDLVRALKKLSLAKFGQCQTQSQFRQLFVKAVDVVDEALLKKNRRNGRVGSGHKWGHSTKVVCLYLREIILNSEYFNDKTTKRLKGFLYVPIDSVVMQHLRECGIRLKVRAIKQIDSEQVFWDIQNILTEAAEEAKVPRILFDEVWSAN